MLKHLLNRKTANTIGMRHQLFVKRLLSTQQETDVKNHVPNAQNINYVFREIRNENLIKDFCFGKFNPKLLKMPDSNVNDKNVHELLYKLAGLDLTNYERSTEQLKQMGVFGALIPTKYGGLDFNSTQFSYLLQNDKLTDWVLPLIAHHNLCAQTIIQYGSEEQMDNYLPKMATGELLGAFCLNEKSSGSDIFSMKTEAILDALENNYVMTGSKSWVINGYKADLFIVFSITHDTLNEGGNNFITAFIVDKKLSGISVSKPYNLDWLSNCQVSDVEFKEVYVPVEMILFEEHAGYKVANHIQNNARYIIGSYMSSLMRTLVTDLVFKENNGLIPEYGYIRHLLDESFVLLYAVESSLYFTTRFADNYLIPEIELESAMVKVFSCETVLKVFNNYRTIHHLINKPGLPDIEVLFQRAKGLQNFLGSNYFTKLYIGGTMLQLSSLSFLDRSVRMNNSPNNIPWLKKLEKKHLIDGPKAVKYYLFLDDLERVYIQLNKCRLLLVKAMRQYKDELMEYQNVMTSLSDLGTIIYILSCCVAHANTTYGDYEAKCTNIMLKKSNLIIENCKYSLNNTVRGPESEILWKVSEDIRIAKGYPMLDVLEMRRYQDKDRYGNDLKVTNDLK